MSDAALLAIAIGDLGIFAWLHQLDNALALVAGGSGLFAVVLSEKKHVIVSGIFLLAVTWTWIGY